MKNLLRLLAFACLTLAALAAPAQATFPVIAATANTNGSSTSSSITVNLPSGISAGNLLIVSVALNQGGYTFTTPSGWTRGRFNSTPTTGESLVVYWKRASGSEGSTLTITIGGNSIDGWATVARRITGMDKTQAPVFGTISSAFNTSHTPPALTVSYGSVDTLWIANFGWGNGSIGAPSYPYTSNQVWAGQSASPSEAIASSTNNDTTATETPGPYTIGTNQRGSAYLIAVPPVLASGNTPITFPFLP